MKKSGFTLAEVLVTLGIIGVVAALVMPAAQKLIPDKTKTQYLKTYDTISTMVNALASNSKLYPVCNQASDASCAEHPLISLGRPIDNRFNNARYSGDSKLCSLMAYNFGVPEADINCSATPYTFNAADYTNNFANPSFTTQNGMRWRIVPQIATSITPENWTARYQTDIYVDINPSNNNVNGSDQSCIYDADSCTNPDIFKFQVAANGKVAAADQKGLDYIKNRTSLTKKTAEIEDVEIADNMIGRGFLYKDCSGNGGECPDGQHWDDETEACVAGGEPGIGEPGIGEPGIGKPEIGITIRFVADARSGFRIFCTAQSPVASSVECSSRINYGRINVSGQITETTDVGIKCTINSNGTSCFQAGRAGISPSGAYEGLMGVQYVNSIVAQIQGSDDTNDYVISNVTAEFYDPGYREYTIPSSKIHY